MEEKRESSDKDGEGVSFRFVGGSTTSGLFRIEGNTGVIGFFLVSTVFNPNPPSTWMLSHDTSAKVYLPFPMPRERSICW